VTPNACAGCFSTCLQQRASKITWTRKAILVSEVDRCAYYKDGVARSSESFVKSNSSDRRRPSALAEGCGRNAGENSPQYALKSLFEYQRTVSARPTSQDFCCRHPSAKSSHHVSLNMTIRDDFDHHRGTRSTQESRLSKFPILEGKAYMFSQGLMQITQYYKIFNGIKLP